ncbi:MAG: hypothetical protein ACXW0R_08825 [Gaiellaceae bacterium]
MAERETPYAAARAMFAATYTGVAGLPWTIACSLIFGAVGVWLSNDSSRGAQVVAFIVLGACGALVSAGVWFGGCLVASPVKQRNAAWSELDRLKRERQFPSGRIESKTNFWFDSDDGERLLVFPVKVTNRETERRMNLEVDVVLRLFTAIQHFNPELKPLEMRLSLIQKGPNPPPDPLPLDAQDSTGDLLYVARWDFDTGLAFNADDHTFAPDMEGDALLLRMLDLQSGKRVEVEVPGVWEG